MRCPSPTPRLGAPRPSRSPVPHLRPRPAGSSPVRQARDRSIPNPLLVAAIPDLGDLAVDDAEHLDTRDVGLGPVLGGHRRVVDNRDVLAVVAGNHDIQVEAQPVEHLPDVLDPVDRLFAGQGMRLPHLVPDNVVGEQVLGQRQVAFVPDHEVVEFDHFARGPHGCHHPTAASSATSRRNRSVTRCTRRENRWPTWLPSYQYSWPPQRSCNAIAGSRIAIRSCHAPTMSRRCGGGAGSTASGSITEVSFETSVDPSSSRNPSRADPHRPRCRAIIALSPRIGVYNATASICLSRWETRAATGLPIEIPDTTTAVACDRAHRTTARTSETARIMPATLPNGSTSG